MHLQIHWLRNKKIWINNNPSKCSSYSFNWIPTLTYLNAAMQLKCLGDITFSVEKTQIHNRLWHKKTKWQHWMTAAYCSGSHKVCDWTCHANFLPADGASWVLVKKHLVFCSKAYKQQSLFVENLFSCFPEISLTVDYVYPDDICLVYYSFIQSMIPTRILKKSDSIQVTVPNYSAAAFISIKFNSDPSSFVVPPMSLKTDKNSVYMW